MSDDLEKFMAEQMKDPDFAAAFSDAQSRSNLHSTLIKLREKGGLSVEEIAARMGVKPQRVRDYEACRLDPRWSTHQRYARAIGHRLSWTIAVSNPASEEENPSA